MDYKLTYLYLYLVCCKSKSNLAFDTISSNSNEARSKPLFIDRSRGFVSDRPREM